MFAAHLYIFTCLPLYLFTCLPLDLLTYLSDFPNGGYLHIHTRMSCFVWPSHHPFLGGLGGSSPIYMPTFSSIYFFVSLYIYVFTCLPVYLLIYIVMDLDIRFSEVWSFAYTKPICREADIKVYNSTIFFT